MKRLTPLLSLVALAALAGMAFPGRSLAANFQAGQHIPVCAAVPAGYARCHAIVVVPSYKPNRGGTAPGGLNPADVQGAYSLPASTKGSGQTVAIVDAYDDPNAESDLAVYRSQFGIAACTTSNGCFRKVNQSGGTSYPRSNGGWAQEISLDLDMVSATCPNCHILLVEASTNSLANLGAAVNEAVSLGASEVSNSYGGSQSSSDPSNCSAYYNHSGVAITASSGDSGYGVQNPADCNTLTAVGGTTLTVTKTHGYGGETVWSGAGSGCSSYVNQQSWQTSNSNVSSVCGKRGEADVAADADPNTGVSVYDSLSYQGLSGWLVFGGTSVASPIIAGVYALAGNASTAGNGSYPYGHASSLHDVTSGSNGSCGNILCNATTGWDGPTGLGTPNGSGGF